MMPGPSDEDPQWTAVERPALLRSAVERLDVPWRKQAVNGQLWSTSFETDDVTAVVIAAMAA